MNHIATLNQNRLAASMADAAARGVHVDTGSLDDYPGDMPDFVISHAEIDRRIKPNGRIKLDYKPSRYSPIDTDDSYNRVTLSRLCEEPIPHIIPGEGHTFGELRAKPGACFASAVSSLDPDRRHPSLHNVAPARILSSKVAVVMDRLMDSISEKLAASEGSDFIVRCAGKRQLVYRNIHRLETCRFACEFEGEVINVSALDIHYEVVMTASSEMLRRAWLACLDQGFTPVGCVSPSVLAIELPLATARTDLARIMKATNRAADGDPLAVRAEGCLRDRLNCQDTLEMEDADHAAQ